MGRESGNGCLFNSRWVSEGRFAVAQIQPNQRAPGVRCQKASRHRHSQDTPFKRPNGNDLFGFTLSGSVCVLHI